MRSVYPYGQVAVISSYSNFLHPNAIWTFGSLAMTMIVLARNRPPPHIRLAGPSTYVSPELNISFGLNRHAAAAQSLRRVTPAMGSKQPNARAASKPDGDGS